MTKDADSGPKLPVQQLAILGAQDFAVFLSILALSCYCYK